MTEEDTFNCLRRKIPHGLDLYEAIDNYMYGLFQTTAIQDMDNRDHRYYRAFVEALHHFNWTVKDYFQELEKTQEIDCLMRNECLILEKVMYGN